MNDMITGSVVKQQVVCNEEPFFVNLNGSVAYKTPDNIIVHFYYDNSHTSAIQMAKALNTAYKFGYEKDRYEWRLVNK